MNLYQQQNSDTFTDIGINTAKPNLIASDIDLYQKRLASKRMKHKNVISGTFYKWDGQSFSIRAV